MITPLFLHNRDETFMIYIFVRTGSIYESSENHGISHSLEHMLFKSSLHYSTVEIIKSFTLIGGDYNAVTDKDVTYYYVKTAAEHWKKNIDLLFSIVFEAQIKPDEWTREKDIVIEEVLNSDIGQYDMDFSSLYPCSHSYTKSVGGTEKTLKGITCEMLRQYYKQYYFNASNIDIVINCPTSYKNQISSFVAEKIQKHIKEAKPIDTPFLTPPKPQVVLQHVPLDKYEVTLTFQAYQVREWTKHVVLNFLNYMLAKSGLYSILMYELREKKGLLYGIDCHTDTFQYLSNTYVRFSTQHPKIGDIIKSIVTLIDKIKSKGVDKKVLLFFKQSYLNMLKYIMANDSYLFLIRAMNHHYGVYDYSKEEYMNIVKKITNDDIMQCAKDVYDFDVMGVYVKGNIDKKKQLSIKHRIDSKNIYKLSMYDPS